MRTRWTSVALCGLIGFALNLWVAHYCLLHHSPPVGVWPHASAQQYWDRYVHTTRPYGPAKFHHSSAAIGCDFLIIDASNPDIPEEAPPRLMITRAGLPLRCLEGMHSWGGVEPAYASAIPIEPRALNVAWVSVLPCRPRIGGMLFNVLFYGGVLWCVLFGPVVLFRSVQADQRRRAQCCQHCGYDLRGNLLAGCPECGWRRPAAS